jgi:hypothetical protein
MRGKESETQPGQTGAGVPYELGDTTRLKLEKPILICAKPKTRSSDIGSCDIGGYAQEDSICRAIIICEHMFDDKM